MVLGTKDQYSYGNQRSLWFWEPRIRMVMRTKGPYGYEEPRIPMVVRTKYSFGYKDQGSVWLWGSKIRMVLRTKDPYGYEDQGFVWIWGQRILMSMGTKDPYGYEDQGSLGIEDMRSRILKEDQYYLRSDVPKVPGSVLWTSVGWLILEPPPPLPIHYPVSSISDFRKSQCYY